MEYWFSLFGMAVAALIVGAIFVFGALVAFVAVASRIPNFHFGSPRNEVELRSLQQSTATILRPGNTEREPLHKSPRIVQHLDMTWWLGLSGRNSTRWFFGLMRFKVHG